MSLVPLILKITTGKEVSCSKDWWFHKKMKFKKKQTWIDYNSLILKQSTGKKLQSLFCQENFKSIAWSPQGIQMWRSSARNSQMSKTFDSFIGESVKNYAQWLFLFDIVKTLSGLFPSLGPKQDQNTSNCKTDII